MALAKQPGEITSYKVLPAALEAMKDAIEILKAKAPRQTACGAGS